MTILPRGPHRLPREVVRESQRQRILLAAAEVMATKGYVATSVSDIVAAAGVSRTTFYQLFEDRLDCFLTASKAAQDILMAAMTEQLEMLESEHELSPRQRISALIEIYLENLASNPGFARVFLVEVYAAGPRAIEQRRKAVDGFVDIFLAAQSTGPESTPETDAQARMVSEVLVAAVSSFVTNAVGAGDLDALRGLRAPIMVAVDRLTADDT
jgi:AcrR family transcriptional regulator